MLLGITGGIATGKSTVTKLLNALGATTFSADEAARAILTPDGPVLAQIAAAFGAEMVTPEGTLDRARLGRLIFADPAARERLNRIMHPPVRRLLRDQIESAQTDLSPGSVIAVEIPLLYENNLQGWFERIVVVTASESVQNERLRIRDHLSATEARQRLSAQWPLAEKVARADDVIVNEGSRAELTTVVEALWQRLSAPGGR